MSRQRAVDPMAACAGRRRVLGLIGGAAALAAAGGLRGQEGAAGCLARPRQTEGPYFLEGALERRDIRSDPEDGSLREGLPLRLDFQVSATDGSTCRPLEGVVVELWQCDALGVYSGVRDVIGGLFDTRGQRFLRGWQRTGADGEASFLTLYPGWYRGRAVHIHFKLRREREGAASEEFSSQLYFDDALSDRVFAGLPYRDNDAERLRNADDFIYRRGGDQLMLAPVAQAEGLAAGFTIALMDA